MAQRLSQKEIESLVKAYLAARERLLDTIVYYKGVGTKTYANTILRQLQRDLRMLEKSTTQFINTSMPREYKASLKEVYSYFTRNKLTMKAPSTFAAIHTDALYEISREMQYQISSGLAHVGRQITRYVNDNLDDTLRSAGLEQAAIKAASGGTVQEMRNALIEQLNNEGFMSIQYGEGSNARQVPIDVYAGMVARSTTREVDNTARLNQLLLNGYDLVKMTVHAPTCSICSQYQGRVYSITGKDTRFPALSKAFGAYNNIHPNCRHSVTPWIESMYTPEEVANEIVYANRPFEDTRGEEERKLYKTHQDRNRKERNNLYQYERYKARLGENAPKSWMAFNRIKKAGGEPWERLQNQYRAMGYYDKALAAEPEITEIVQDVANKSGMQIVGFDFKIKEKETFLRKVDANYSPDGTAYEVKDIIRYTFVGAPREMATQSLRSIELFHKMGYNTSSIKNYWLNTYNPYKGVNTFVSAPSGQVFEVQYHTPESFALKNGELHDLYELQRLLTNTESIEYIQLQSKMFELSNKLPVPTGIERIKNR